MTFISFIREAVVIVVLISLFRRVCVLELRLFNMMLWVRELLEEKKKNKGDSTHEQ